MRVADIVQLPCYTSLRGPLYKHRERLAYLSLDDVLLASFSEVTYIDEYIIITGNFDLYRLNFLPNLKAVGGNNART